MAPVANPQRVLSASSRNQGRDSCGDSACGSGWVKFSRIAIPPAGSPTHVTAPAFAAPKQGSMTALPALQRQASVRLAAADEAKQEPDSVRVTLAWLTSNVMTRVAAIPGDGDAAGDGDTARDGDAAREAARAAVGPAGAWGETAAGTVAPVDALGAAAVGVVCVVWPGAPASPQATSQGMMATRIIARRMTNLVRCNGSHLGSFVLGCTYSSASA